MSTTATPVRPVERPAQRVHTTHVLVPGATRCDRSACPAPATRRVELYEQDFYFCGHHWREMVAAFASPLARTTRAPWT